MRNQFCKEENVKSCSGFHAALTAPWDLHGMDGAGTPALLLAPSLGTSFPFPYSEREHGDVLSPDLEAPMVMKLLHWAIP